MLALASATKYRVREHIKRRKERRNQRERGTQRMWENDMRQCPLCSSVSPGKINSFISTSFIEFLSLSLPHIACECLVWSIRRNYPNRRRQSEASSALINTSKCSRAFHASPPARQTLTWDPSIMTSPLEHKHC